MQRFLLLPPGILPALLLALLCLGSCKPSQAQEPQSDWKVEYTVSGTNEGDMFMDPGPSWILTPNELNPGVWVNFGAGGYERAKSTGTITAKIIWRGSGPPPPKVIVTEHATAQAHTFGAYSEGEFQGTAINGLGSPSIRTPGSWPQEWKDSGYGLDEYVYSDGSSAPQVFDVPQSGENIGKVDLPSRTLTAESQQSFLGPVDAGVSYKVDVRSLEILKDGQRLFGDNKQALPGELIRLTVTGADSVASWVQPSGQIFWEYYPSIYGAILQEFTSGHLADQELTFRWKEGDDTERTVSANAIVAGQTVTVTGKILVGKPVSTMVGTPGYIYRDLGIVSFDPIPMSAHQTGYSWNGSTVTVPFHGGKFAFFQTGTVHRSGIAQNGNSYRLPASASSGLDGGVPYKGLDWDVTQVVNPPKHAGDTPQDNFGPQTAPFTFVSLTRLTISDSFTTWLMFKSSKTNSNWVPVREFDWSWGAVAVPRAGTFPQAGESQTLPPSQYGAETTRFPLWSSQINPGAFWVQQ